MYTYNTKSMNDEEIIREANRILEQATIRNVNIKLMGAISFRLQCPNHIDLFNKMKRKLTDIDFISLSEENKNVLKLFKALGYTPDRDVLLSQEYGLSRYMFHHPNSKFHIDVFFDKLKMCHTIDLRERLDIENKTISLSDMLLEKMQIVEINEKDVIDVIVLLLEHDIGNNDRKKVDIKYISKLMSDDWGFYHTSTTNLNKAKNILERYNCLSTNEKLKIIKKIDLILKSLEEEPKTLKWRLRSKIGTRLKWYNEVSLI